MQNLQTHTQMTHATAGPAIYNGHPLPSLNIDGDRVDPRSMIEPGTGLWVGLGYTVLGILMLVLAATLYGLILAVAGPIVDWFNRKKVMALLRGSTLEVGPEQMPELHRCAVTFAQRLGMSRVPDIFIVEDNTINAFAHRVAGRKVIILNDDVVDACLRSGEPRTLSFVLGHELAHHALGHTGFFRALIGRHIKRLSRLDELSCDAVAGFLVGNPGISARAIVTLLTGPQLLPYVNLNKLNQQAAEIVSDPNARKAERYLTHPMLLRRLHRFQS